MTAFPVFKGVYDTIEELTVLRIVLLCLFVKSCCLTPKVTMNSLTHK